MKRIDLEAHFITKEIVEALYKRKKYPTICGRSGHEEPQVVVHRRYGGADWRSSPEKLLDLEENRLKSMDAAGIDVQCLSLTTPGVECLDRADREASARSSNGHLARPFESTRTVRWIRHPGPERSECGRRRA